MPSLLLIPRLVVTGASIFIIFLAYSSQLLFWFIEPFPLSIDESLVFNVLVVCVALCYYRAITTDPGRVPSDWSPDFNGKKTKVIDGANAEEYRRRRWCRKCNALKPPRAHHCKICARCIPKMDHHCPWTANCVSHRTFPHFLRLVFYAVASMSYLEWFLYLRAKEVMDPQYLGPSVPALIHLFILIVLNSFTLFMLSILLVRSIWSLAVNTTTIEGWEIERHETLVRRARYLGGYLDGPDGKRIRIQKQEFPYDIGIWQNIKQGMGTSNVLAWLWPFASTPSMKSGLSFEINGFEDENLSWPPPDPDRVLRIKRAFDPEDAFTRENDHLSEQERINAFRQRQGIDFERRTINGELVVRQKTFAQRYSQLGPVDGETDEEEDTIHSDSSSSEGEEGWRTADGERLRDFGVDEEVDFYDEHDVIPDEDDIPLAELMRRRGIRK